MISFVTLLLEGPNGAVILLVCLEKAKLGSLILVCFSASCFQRKRSSVNMSTWLQREEMVPGLWVHLAGQVFCRKGRTGLVQVASWTSWMILMRSLQENAKWFEEQLATACQKLGSCLRLLGNLWLTL